MESKMEMPRIMTIPQAAKTGILPAWTIRTLVKQGKVPSFKVGNRTYLNLDALLNFLESSKK